MARKNIGLRQGTQAHLEGGMQMGLVRVIEGTDGVPPEVVVCVKDEEEKEYTLHPGDSFLIGEQTWKLDRIGEPVRNRWGAVFSRVD
ncbi:DUF6406 domain-containing protein [Actinomadura luteofluorescens]|uniref:Sorbitol-specific phosphotransferase system component IIA n=1 Tax=Actinomadura luteofluorescens TaxID=46163 RepID=A0A7Y9EEY6_9ACTN|nr:DUF6406 domain-containing protein [Actinomadura luteofluorescens]NYD46528.1 sorbitol-specific phosphotransferase system component IIA [Actinomadura luteofluorescens]